MLPCEWDAVEGEDVVIRVHEPFELQGVRVGSIIIIIIHDDNLRRAVLCGGGGVGYHHLVLRGSSSNIHVFKLSAVAMHVLD